jgi:WD40 repeat protein
MFTGGVIWFSGQAAGEALASYLEMGQKEDGLPVMPGGLASLLQACLQDTPGKRPEDMGVIAGHLVNIFQTAAGRVYGRQEPKGVQLRADSLNNKALSLLDLGQEAEAEGIWEAALAADPHHPEAIYNLGMTRWRAGKQTDDELLVQMDKVLEALPGQWRLYYLMGLAHVERADGAAAEQALAAARRLAPQENAIAEAQRLLPHVCKERLLHSLPQVGESLLCMQLMPGGQQLLSGHKDGKLRLWDLPEGRLRRVLESDAGELKALAVSSRGRYAIAADEKYTLRLWDLVSGECIQTIIGFQGDFDALAFIQNGTDVILSGGTGNEAAMFFNPDARGGLFLLEPGSGQIKVRFEAVTHTWHWAVTSTADGRRVVTADGKEFMLSPSASGAVRIWDPASGRCLRVLEHPSHVYGVCLHSDGRRLVSASADGLVRLWDLETGEVLHVFPNHGSAAGVMFDASGRSLICAGNKIRVWDFESRRCLHTFPNCAGFSGIVLDGRALLVTNEEKILQILSLEGLGETQVELAVSRPMGAAAQAQISSLIDNAKRDARLALESGRFAEAAHILGEARAQPGFGWEAELSELWHQAGRSGGRRAGLRGWRFKMLTEKGLPENANKMTVTPDWRNLICTGIAPVYSDLTLWDLEKQEVGKRIPGKAGLFNYEDLTVLDGGRFLFRVEPALMYEGQPGWERQDTTHALRLCDFVNGQVLSTVDVPLTRMDKLKLAGYSPDGWRMLLFHKWSRQLKNPRKTRDGGFTYFEYSFDLQLWDMERKRRLYTKRISEEIFASAVLPNGRNVLLFFANSFGSAAPVFQLWDMERGRGLQVYKGHTTSINHWNLSADGRHLLTLSQEEMRLWDVQKGICRQVIRLGPDAAREAKFVLKDRCALTEHDNALRLWDLESGTCRYVYPTRRYMRALSPDQSLGLLSGDGKFVVWDIASGQELLEMNEVNSFQIAFSEDLRWLRFVDVKGNLGYWELDWDYTFP